MRITIEVAVDEAIRFACDVLVMMYPQHLYGASAAVHRRFERKGWPPELPAAGAFSLMPAHGVVGARRVLYIGVKAPEQLDYAEIRQFARRALSALAAQGGVVEHLALKLHGPGLGLDEVESFESELAGLVDAVGAADVPNALRRITFVEHSSSAAARLRQVLLRLVPGGELVRTDAGCIGGLDPSAQKTLRLAGYGAADKQRVFVAMPFTADMSDVFHYGLQNAIHAAGMLAERADLASFSGDVMQWVKERIQGASFVVADLTGANPNVYLEVGFAWGLGVPTILVVRQQDQLPFDVRGQRCLAYGSIRELEEKLSAELSALSALRA